MIAEQGRQADRAPGPNRPRWSDGLTWQRLLSELPHRIAKPLSATQLRSAIDLAGMLISESSEAQAVRIAEELAELLGRLEEKQFPGLFSSLSSQFGHDEEALGRAARDYAIAPDPRKAASLLAAAEPRHQELFRRINMAPGGTSLIVGLREKMLDLKREQPDIAPLERVVHQLLASWFNRGFLRLERISWESPAALLENVIRYEAVHEIREWISLRSRVEVNRRCFGFFHPAMPGVPLIFVEVALTMEMSSAIEPLLSLAGDEAPLPRPTNAIFYSINNCLRGLKGINLGDLLIKQVVRELRNEFPSLQEFATLSPIPGFRRWLDNASASDGVLTERVAEALRDPLWHREPGLAEGLKGPLTSLCAEYLTGHAPGGEQAVVSDPVAKFHLTNGARIERINWLADLSDKGLGESFGLMVNYRYLPASIESNHRTFVNEGKVAMSSGVKQLTGRNRKAARRTLLDTIGGREK